MVLFPFKLKVTMQNNYLTPILGNSTKSSIIQILTEKPLTLKEIQHQLERISSKPITYQATHKATTEMINDEILTKTANKKIEISKDWIYNLENFTKSLKSLNNQAGLVTVYCYDSFGKFVSAIIRFVHDAPNEKKLEGVCLTKHAWPPIGLSKQDYELLTKLLSETKYYDVSTRKSPLGEAFAKTLEKMGKTVKVGSKLNNQLDFICKGDDTFEVSFEKDLQDQMERIFKKHKTLDENAINDVLMNIMTKKTLIKIIHTHSSEYAKELREKVLKEFN